MALYDYKCECGHSKEVSHSIAEVPKVECPECTKLMRKSFGIPVITFNGEGFYSTDKKNDR